MTDGAKAVRRSKRDTPQAEADPPLSQDELLALIKAGDLSGMPTFPRTDVIQKLYQTGYVEIVIGGLKATPEGLARLARERMAGK
ncbi:MAG: hypothetical protein INR62_08070 [Rhodospirillales bacterium]|nr:hypothetical protein [Acetobacter sp.]